MDDMLETMYDAPGIGLAAIQIGVPKRIIVLDISKDPEKKEPMYFVNPEIIYYIKKNATYEEGCLSVPNNLLKLIDQTNVILNIWIIMENPKNLKQKVY